MKVCVPFSLIITLNIRKYNILLKINKSLANANFCICKYISFETHLERYYERW